MRKYTFILAFLALFMTQVSFAKKGDIKECDPIAEACKSAGFTDEENMGDKSFWFGCMRPVLFGKNVNGVTVEMKDIKACRRAKIAKMRKEIQELQSVK